MGGHDHGHGHHPPYTIPDYKMYKVEDVPELMITKRALAAQGLKDPWLRNEVWRYSAKEFGTQGERIYLTFFRGFKLGFAAFVATMVGTYAYDKLYPPKHGHGHEDDHH